MKTENSKCNFDYQIDTDSLYKEFKIVRYIRNQIVLINASNSYIYKEAANENVTLIQSILDSSKIRSRYFSTSAIIARNNAKNRFSIPIESGELLCIVRDSNDEKCTFLSLYFEHGKIERIKTIRSFNKENSPFIISSLPHSYFNDVHIISDTATKSQLIGLIHPCFFLDNTLYISIHTQSKKHSAVQISKLLRATSDLLNEFCILDVNDIQTCITLMSPGNVLFFLESAIEFIENNWQGVLLLYILLFGGTYTNGDFSIEAPSIRNFISHILNHKMNKKMKEFELTKKELELKKLKIEVDSLEKQIQAEDESIDTSMNLISDAVQTLTEVSSEIDIAIPDDEYIDLNEIMSILENPVEDDK